MISFYLTRIFRLGFVFLICGLIFFGWYRLLGGFRIDKIESPLVKKEINVPSCEIINILNQKFRYLDKGCQAYVFESEDKNYVLKIVRFSRYKIPFWMHFIKWTKKGAIKKERRENLKNRLLKMSLASYELAFERLKDLTHVEYVHLHQTNFFTKKLILKDVFQREFTLDPNKVAFILQKKALPLEKYLLECKKNNDINKTKMILDCFFKTTENLLSRNILNKDYNCIKNTGIIDKSVIYMDVGSFVKNSTLQKEDRYNHFLRYSSKYFRKWGRKNFPEMLPFFEETYKSNLKKVS